MRNPELTTPDASTLLVLPLSRISTAVSRAEALSLVGGKAANLGEMIAAGLPVPGGFCLTTRAYALAADEAGVAESVEALAGVAPGDPEIPRLAADIRTRLSTVTPPREVADATAAAYAELAGVTGTGADTTGADTTGGDTGTVGGDTGTASDRGRVPAVAVRSSATAEDLPFASFAGQQDTFLEMVGIDAVLDAVRRCWASLWTDRAVSYRAGNGIDHRSVRLAVVVQRMVPARTAGVLFTADPMTGRRARAVIDAAPGLGEAVVSGAVNPDHFVVDTASGEVLDRSLGDKRVRITAAAGGGVERAEVAPASETECLSPAELTALARLGGRVEEHYGGTPQDIEWAVDAGGELWLTQARPITTVYPLPARPADATRTPDTSPSTSSTPGEASRDPGGPPRDPGDLRVYFSANVAQGVFGPLTPMGIAMFRLVGSALSAEFGMPRPDPVAGPPVAVVAGSRLFIDVTAVVRSRIGRRVFPSVLAIMEARSRVVMESLFDDPRLSVVHRSPWPFLRRVLSTLLRAGVPARIARTIARPATLRDVLAEMEAEVLAVTDVPADATAEERLDAVQNAILHHIGKFLPRVMPAIMFPYVGLQHLAGRLLGDRATGADLSAVLRGLPHNPTTEMDLELWRLADTVRGDADSRRLLLETSATELARRYHDGSLPAAVREPLAAFLDTYGHRGVAEIDVGVARWSDDPAHILNALTNYLRLDGEAAAPAAQFERSARAGEDAVAELAARLGNGLRARIVRFCLSRVREIGGLRERPKFIIVLLFARLRAQLALVGAELVARGRLSAADDIFMVDLPEARAGLADRDLRPLVRERRAVHEAESRRRHVPRILLSDGSEPEAMVSAAAVDGDDDGTALRGSAASSGQVTAPARVVLDPAGAHLEPGEILVAPSTDPGWTPLFLTAGGLVMEMGGAMSHGAVVAREYGIPAVVGVAGATTTIGTGDEITVDGSAGRVLLKEEPADVVGE